MSVVRYGLLIFIPIAVLAEHLHGSPLLIFFSAAVGVVPLAAWMGVATEHLAVRTGPRLGGLLNATLGNAAELIITLVALHTAATHPELRDGLNELVKASITGSVLGNVLLVLGLSALCGGLKHGTQTFDRSHAGVNGTMLILAVIALAIPSIFGHAIEQVDHVAVIRLSEWVAVVMIAVYALGLVYSLKPGQGPLEAEPEEALESEHEPSWSLGRAGAVLLVATVLIAWLSEILVGAVEPVVKALGVTEFFLGVILIPLVGNVAEHFVAVQVAMANRMELSLAISIGSSLQIALFVAPLLVFAGMLMGNPLTLVFNVFELSALGVSALIAALISGDGESNWLEGVQLLVVYLIIGIAFYFLPA